MQKFSTSSNGRVAGGIRASTRLIGDARDFDSLNGVEVTVGSLPLESMRERPFDVRCSSSRPFRTARTTISCMNSIPICPVPGKWRSCTPQVYRNIAIHAPQSTYKVIVDNMRNGGPKLKVNWGTHKPWQRPWLALASHSWCFSEGGQRELGFAGMKCAAPSRRRVTAGRPLAEPAPFPIEQSAGAVAIYGEPPQLDA